MSCSQVGASPTSSSRALDLAAVACEQVIDGRLDMFRADLREGRQGVEAEQRVGVSVLVVHWRSVKDSGDRAQTLTAFERVRGDSALALYLIPCSGTTQHHAQYP